MGLPDRGRVSEWLRGTALLWDPHGPAPVCWEAESQSRGWELIHSQSWGQSPRLPARRLNRLAGATARVLFALSKALGPPQELFLHLGAWQGCLERSGPPLPLTTTPPSPPALPTTSRRSVSAWVSRPRFPKLSRRSATGRQPGSDLRVGRGVVQVRYRSRELRRV